MPTYRYRCDCGHKEDAFRRVADRDDAPLHCSMPMERIIMPTMVAPSFTPYRTAAIDKERGKRLMITNRDEHRAFLARNGYQEIGNDRSMAPPSAEEIADLAASKKPANVEYQLNEDTMEARA